MLINFFSRKRKINNSINEDDKIDGKIQSGNSSAGCQGASSKTSSPDTNAEKLRLYLEFRIRYNLIIHEEYAEYFAQKNRDAVYVGLLLAFLSLISFGGFIDSTFLACFGFVSVVISLKALVYKYSEKAFEYSKAETDLRKLLARVRNGCEKSEIDVVEKELADINVYGKINEISRALAYNEAMDNVPDYDDGERYVVHFWQRWTRFVFPWGNPRHEEKK